MGQSAFIEPSREEQSALIAAAFLVDGAAEQLAEASLSNKAFPEPLHQALYQLVCRFFQQDKQTVLSEVAHRQTIVPVVAEYLNQSESHAQNFWQQILHAGSQLHRTEFRALLSRFKQYERFEELKTNLPQIADMVAGFGAGDVTIEKMVRPLEDLLVEVKSLNTIDHGTSSERWRNLSASIGDLDGEFLTTGFLDWDRLITKSGSKTGQPLGSIHFMSAPAGHGKSTLLRSLLKQQCFGLNYPTCYFNFEISEREFIEDMFAAVMNISPYQKWDWIKRFEADGVSREEALSRWDQAKRSFADYIVQLSEKNIFDVVHHMAFELDDVMGIIDARYRQGYRIFMVDTINRIKHKGARGQRHDELETIIYALEQQALRLNCIIDCAAQENRDKWKRVDKTPTVADLAGASAIEKAAYSVTQLYRTDYYTAGQVDYSEGIITKARGRGVGSDSRFRLLFSRPNHCYVPYPESRSGEKVVTGDPTASLPPMGGAVITAGGEKV